MGSVIWNENKNAIVDYMQPYLGQKLADCTLYSQDGFEFPIHKVYYNSHLYTVKDITEKCFCFMIELIH